MRIRYTARQLPAAAGYAVWDTDEGRWDSSPFATLAEAKAAAQQASEEFWSSVQERAARQAGTAIGLYFAGMDKEQVNAMRAKINQLAANLGYTAQGGPTRGEGNAAALLVGIANGEVTVQRRQQG